MKPDSRYVTNGSSEQRRRFSNRAGGGRTRWAHSMPSSASIARSFCCKQIEDLMNVKGIGEKAFLKLKPLLTITSKADASGGTDR